MGWENTFFPSVCEWGEYNKKGEWIQCTDKRVHITEPELKVYCKFHYSLIMKYKAEEAAREQKRVGSN